MYPEGPSRPPARLAMILPMRVLASLRRLPRYPLEVFFGTRLLIWGTTILAYLVFEAQYAQPLHTGRR